MRDSRQHTGPRIQGLQPINPQQNIRSSHIGILRIFPRRPSDRSTHHQPLIFVVRRRVQQGRTDHGLVAQGRLRSIFDNFGETVHPQILSSHTPGIVRLHAGGIQQQIDHFAGGKGDNGACFDKGHLRAVSFFLALAGPDVDVAVLEGLLGSTDFPGNPFVGLVRSGELVSHLGELLELFGVLLEFCARECVPDVLGDDGLGDADEAVLELDGCLGFVGGNDSLCCGGGW